MISCIAADAVNSTVTFLRRANYFFLKFMWTVTIGIQGSTASPSSTVLIVEVTYLSSNIR